MLVRHAGLSKARPCRFQFHRGNSSRQAQQAQDQATQAKGGSQIHTSTPVRLLPVITIVTVVTIVMLS
jgi:hypothetical protein